ncbi:hypothetical protein BH23CHL2_BH23CHL2_35010 [soil metagenome]
MTMLEERLTQERSSRSDEIFEQVNGQRSSRIRAVTRNRSGRPPGPSSGEVCLTRPVSTIIGHPCVISTGAQRSGEISYEIRLKRSLTLYRQRGALPMYVRSQ